jgi:hypothetical protein
MGAAVTTRYIDSSRSGAFPVPELAFPSSKAKSSAISSGEGTDFQEKSIFILQQRTDDCNQGVLPLRVAQKLSQSAVGSRFVRFQRPVRFRGEIPLHFIAGLERRQQNGWPRLVANQRQQPIFLFDRTA